MPGKSDGWSFCANMTLISSISKGKKIRWLMHSAEKCTNYMLQPLACTTEMKDRILEAANADLQYKNLVAKLQQRERPQTKESYTLGTDGLLLHKNRVYVPNV